MTSGDSLDLGRAEIAEGRDEIEIEVDGGGQLASSLTI
jgi:hypothetical protein